MSRFKVAAAMRRLVELLNHDFCPSWNRYLGWLRRPIGWLLIGSLAAAMVALVLEPRVWSVVAALGAVMLIGLGWPHLSLAGIRANLSFECSRCREQETIRVRLTITNRFPFPAWGIAIQNGFFLPNSKQNSPSSNETAPIAAVARVAPWSHSEFEFEFVPEMRGVYPNSAPALVTGFPFGIGTASRTVQVDGELLVWPRITSLLSTPLLEGVVRDVCGTTVNRSGAEGEIIGLRPYRPGDRLRSIHWAQSARRNSWIVTERQSVARCQVTLAIDTAAFRGDGTGPTFDGTPQLELAIRIAASIAASLHAHHTQIRFIIDQLDLQLSPGSSGIPRLLDSLARFIPAPDQAPLPTRLERNGRALIVTTSAGRLLWNCRGASSLPVHCIVIQDPADGPTHSMPLITVQRTSSPPATRMPSAWLEIESRRDYEKQLQQQWERVCHESC